MDADFWGVVVPTWLGALGTIAASAVALVAYLAGRAAQGGVKQLAEGLNRSPSTAASEDREGLLPDQRAVEPWLLDHDGPAVRFRNTSGGDVTVVNVEGVQDVPISLKFDLPARVPATAAIRMIVHRIIGGPAVTGVTLTWLDEHDRERSRTYYL